MARGGVGIVQISSMFVTVGARVERNFWEWLKDPLMEQAAAGRRKCQGQISPCQGGFPSVFCMGFVTAKDPWPFLSRMMTIRFKILAAVWC